MLRLPTLLAPTSPRCRWFVELCAFAFVVGCGGTPGPGPADDPLPPPAPAEREDDASGGPLLTENLATALLMGSALLESGDVQAALPYYRFAWDASDADPAVGERYVEAALRAGHPREALSVLARIQADDPEDVEVGLHRGRLLLMLGEQEKADRVSDELLVRAPDRREVLELRLDVLRVGDRFDEALVVLDRMREASPDELDLQLARGDLLRRAGRVQEAEASWRAVLEVDPSHLGAVDRLSDLLREQGRGEELLGLLEEALLAAGRAPMQEARLADLYLALGNTERAIELLLPLAEDGELEPHAILVLCDLLASNGQTEKAVEILAANVESADLPAPFHRLLGELEMELDRFDDAERSLRRAVKLDPRDANAVVSLLLLLGQVEPDLLARPGDVDEPRRAEFERLLGLAIENADSNSVRQNYLTGALLRRREDFARAQPLLERAAQLDPGNRQILYDLAVAQEGLKDYEAAAVTLEQLVELDPEDAHLLNFYGYLLADQGWQLDRAETMIRKAVEEEPENGFYADSLGWVYYRQGRLEEAFDELVRASNLVGDDPVVLEHLGDVLRDLGRPEEALRVYRRALALGGESERLRPRVEEMERVLREGP